MFVWRWSDSTTFRQSLPNCSRQETAAHIYARASRLTRLGSTETDRKIIVQLYQSTNGNNWYRQDGWDDNDLDLGSWFGVKTNDEGQVVELNLGNNNLRGKKSVTCKETVFGTCEA